MALVVQCLPDARDDRRDIRAALGDDDPTDGPEGAAQIAEPARLVARDARVCDLVEARARARPECRWRRRRGRRRGRRRWRRDRQGLDLRQRRLPRQPARRAAPTARR